LPADAREIGFLAGSDDASYSLWRPFGQRRVIYLRQAGSDFVEHPGDIEWLIVKENQWPDMTSTPLAEWAGAHGFKIIFSAEIEELVSWGPEKWTLLHREAKHGGGTQPSAGAGRRNSCSAGVLASGFRRRLAACPWSTHRDGA